MTTIRMLLSLFVCAVLTAMPRAHGATATNTPLFEKAWSVALGGEAHMMIIQDGIVYTQWPTGLLSAVSLTTGEVLHTLNGVAYATAPAILGNHIYSLAKTNLYEITRDAFTLARTIPIPNACYQENLPVNAITQRAFIRRKSAGSVAQLSAIDLPTGAIAWTTDFPGCVSWNNCNNPVLADGAFVYVNNSDGKANQLWTLRQPSGEVRSVTDLPYSSRSQYNNMIYDAAHGIFYISLYDGGCCAVRKHDGQVLWHVTFPGYTVRSTLTYHDGSVYVPLYKQGGTGAYCALRATDGETIWQQEGFFGEDGWSATAVCDRYLYRNTHGFATHIIVQDRFTGKLVWSKNVHAPQPCTNPVQAGGLVIFGNCAGLFALRVGNGEAVDCPWHGINGTGFNPGAITWADDADSDMLPDIWELKCFASLDYGATNDVDADGLSNCEEFVAGTDALDRSSRFEIGIAHHTSDTTLYVDGPGTEGSEYAGSTRYHRFEASGDACEALAWLPVQDGTRLADTGATVSVCLPMVNARQTYRAQAWLETPE